MGGQDLKGYLKGTLKVPLKGTFERRGRAQPQWFSLRIIEDLARMVQYMPKQRGNCLCQMERKHQVLCKLPDKVQLQVWIGVSHIDFIAAPFK